MTAWRETSEAREEAVVRSLVAAAREILKDDPDLLQDFGGFARVMWDDDSERKKHGVSADEYGHLLRKAFRALEAAR
jgi:hypothetical protein